MKFVLAILTVLAVHGHAVAQTTCQSACGLEKKACLVGPRANMAACRLGCRANATAGELGACLHGCADAFRSDREQCKGGVADCVASCRSVDSAAASSDQQVCLGGCGQGLGACALDVATTARECIRDCREASDRLECLQACGATAEGGAENCASQFSSCRTDCDVPPPVPSCGRAEAPTCDGSCPLPVLACAPVSEARCGCVPAS